ncbi:MAG: thioredoxin [Kiritimatiellae bacterium]|jgi:thioredoxin 1|nr:thioredoxin [Kiritimatiellia bacterium]
MANGVLDLGESDFLDTIAKGVVLVDFWAPWCGPCKMQTPILENQVVAQVADKAKVAKVNVDENKSLAAKYSIKSIPAILIFKDGEIVKQFTGLQRAEALIAAIEESV